MLSQDFFYPDCPECSAAGDLNVTRCNTDKTFWCQACSYQWDPDENSPYYKFDEMSTLERRVLLLRVIANYDIEQVRNGSSFQRQSIIDARQRLRKRQKGTL